MVIESVVVVITTRLITWNKNRFRSILVTVWKKKLITERVDVVYDEEIKWELQRILIHECRCNERIRAKAEGSTLLAYTCAGDGTNKCVYYNGQSESKGFLFLKKKIFSFYINYFLKNNLVGNCCSGGRYCGGQEADGSQVRSGVLVCAETGRSTSTPLPSAGYITIWAVILHPHRRRQQEIIALAKAKLFWLTSR
jgi:hypothetical protein